MVPLECWHIFLILVFTSLTKAARPLPDSNNVACLSNIDSISVFDHNYGRIVLK